MREVNFIVVTVKNIKYGTMRRLAMIFYFHPLVNVPLGAS